MKYSTTEVFIIWLALTLNCFAQDKIFKEVLPEKFTNKGLKEIHNPNFDVVQRINDIDSLLLKSLNNTWKTALRNPKREFYEEEGFNDKDTRTTINKTLLDNCFVLIEKYEQHWDRSSSVWVNYSKDSYIYDVNNNETEWLHQNWGGSNWVNRWKYSYAYDVNNNLAEEEHYHAREDSGMVKSKKYIYTYDGNNNLTEELHQLGEGSAWANSQKISCTYDGNNNLIEYLYNAWDGSNWLNSEKHSYSYGENNKPIDKLWKSWDGTGWVDYIKTFFTYDGNNNQIELFSQYWEDSDWVNLYKESHSYDENNNITEYFDQAWDGSTWLNSDRHLYTYDINNNLIEDLWQNGWLNGNNSGWVNLQMNSYTYDVNHNRTEWIIQYWEDSAWVNYYNYKIMYIYDVNNNQIEELWQSWDGSDWVNSYKLIYSYIPTDVEEFTSEFNDYSLSNNYPNPFNPSTTIRYSISTTSQVIIKVFDILGNEIKTIVDGKMSPGKYEVLFDASGLSSGTYFYQLRTENFVQTKKMLILK